MYQGNVQMYIYIYIRIVRNKRVQFTKEGVYWRGLSYRKCKVLALQNVPEAVYKCLLDFHDVDFTFYYCSFMNVMVLLVDICEVDILSALNTYIWR